MEGGAVPGDPGQARAEGAELYFGDEAGVRTDFHAGTTWAPVGQTPVVEVTGERGAVNMISAVSPAGALKFDVVFGRVDATVFVEFLTKLVHDAPGPVCLILDNLSVHKSKTVSEVFSAISGGVRRHEVWAAAGVATGIGVKPLIGTGLPRSDPEEPETSHDHLCCHA